MLLRVVHRPLQAGVSFEPPIALALEAFCNFLALGFIREGWSNLHLSTNWAVAYYRQDDISEHGAVLIIVALR